MSNKSKRVAKGLGASALAVATIASGLSFGAASATAAPANVAAASPAAFKFVTKLADNSYAAIGSSANRQVFTTRSAAEAWAQSWIARDKGDGAFTINKQGDEGSCLSGQGKAYSNAAVMATSLSSSNCGENPALRNLWKQASNGALVLRAVSIAPDEQGFGGGTAENATLLNEAGLKFAPHYDQSGYARLAGGSQSNGWDSVPSDVLAPEIDVTASISAAAYTSGDGTVTISGSATPGSEIKTTTDPAAGWVMPEGGKYVVPADGTFRITTKRIVAGQAVVRAELSGDVEVSNRVEIAPLITSAVRTPAGKVTVTGVTTPGARVKTTDNTAPGYGWFDSFDGGQLFADANGAFTGTTTSLVNGQAVVKAFRGDVASPESNRVTPVQKFASLTAAGSFPDDVTKRAVLSGTAEPNTRIEARDTDGTLIASTTSGAQGAWSVEIPAPNKGVLYTLRVNQIIDGTANGDKQVDFQYGKAVSITSLSDGDDAATGTLALAGDGEPGGKVEVAVDGTKAATTTVGASGSWLANVTLTRGEHTIKATQTAKGANTTTTTVTVNPGDTIVDLTAAGRFDADDASKPATAYGAAPSGSTVILRNSVGTEIGRGTAAADNTYAITIDPSKATTGVNTFSVIVQGEPSNAKSFTLDYGTIAPIVVTTPTKNGTVEPGTVRFAGTGQPGSKIVVRGSTRQVATATVNAQGNWSADSSVQLLQGSYNLYFEQTSKGGLKSAVQHPFTLGAVAPVVTPPTVTSPGSGDVLDTLTPEFRGTGHEGATITVRGSSRVIATGTVRNGQWVATTSAASPLAPGTYNLYVDQTVRGTVTSTIRIAFTVSNEAFRELTLSAPAQNENVSVLRPTFVGTATPGATIRVGSSRTTVATTTVAADGTWRATADFDLARGGTYAGLEVKQTLKSGKTSTVAANFTVDRNAQ